MSVDFDTLANGPAVATFGQAVTYQPVAGAPFAITGIFDEAWQDVEFEESRHGRRVPVSTVKPALGVRLADFPPGVTPAQGDSFTLISGESHVVADVQPDGFGMAYLLAT